MSETGQRLDKWLWHARFAKTRGRAQALCESGQVRLNRAPVSKSHATVRAGDVLTFPAGAHIRVVRVLACAERRGPAREAQALYEDLAPPDPATRIGRAEDAAGRPAGAGRPTKRDRRATDRLLGR